MPRDLSAPDLLNLEDAEGEAFGCLEYLEGDGVLGRAGLEEAEAGLCICSDGLFRFIRQRVFLRG